MPRNTKIMKTLIGLVEHTCRSGVARSGGAAVRITGINPAANSVNIRVRRTRMKKEIKKTLRKLKIRSWPADVYVAGRKDTVWRRVYLTRT